MTGIKSAEALNILKTDSKTELLEIFSRANAVREKYSGKRAGLCFIINAKCGNCPQDCAFCAQSKISNAEIRKYPLVPENEILKAAEEAYKSRATNFSIVTSGKAVSSDRETEILCSAVKKIKEKYPFEICASLGSVESEVFNRLREAGISRYHHNLETAESYFDKICSTGKYSEKTETIKKARKAGLSVCSGGIFGMGESFEQRIELLETLRSLDTDAVPLNFLTPVKGTKLENIDELTPYDCLKIIAAARLMMPEKSIKICGGREYNLRDFQSLVFAAGADSIMTGGYLVTAGRGVKADLQMIRDAGLSAGTEK